MRFPNLVWAIGQHRLAHYEVAGSAGMSEARFSRCLNGRFEFSEGERVKIAGLLGYSQEWLFEQITLPELAKLIEDGGKSPTPLRHCQRTSNSAFQPERC